MWLLEDVFSHVLDWWILPALFPPYKYNSLFTIVIVVLATHKGTFLYNNHVQCYKHMDMYIIILDNCITLHRIQAGISKGVST